MFKQILFQRGSSFIDDEEELTNGGLYETFRLFHFNKYFIFNFFFLKCTIFENKILFNN